MLKAHIPAVKQQAFIGLFVFVAGVWLAWEAGGQIASGDLTTPEYAGLAVLACTAALVILGSWRTGFYFFLIWLLFEDLPRKFMGNGLALFFGKDILAALTYVSLYIAIQKGREKSFRPHSCCPSRSLSGSERSRSSSRIRPAFSTDCWDSRSTSFTCL